MVRTAVPNAPGTIHWNPLTGEIDRAALEGLDAVIHLAGENVGAGRWTTQRRAAIRASRVDGTKLLTTTLAGLDEPPRTLVCASAIGFYGDRGTEELDEASEPGRGFLPELCQAWEDAGSGSSEAGIRVVNVRIGVVLAAHGGALSRMVGPFRLGLGGVVGSGHQYVSWISLADVVRALEHCLMSESLAGPVNAVAPEPATNRELTRTLGRVLRRPTLFPLPAFAVRAAFGEMGKELLLASARVQATRLLADGFEFRHASLDSALRDALGK